MRELQVFRQNFLNFPSPSFIRYVHLFFCCGYHELLKLFLTGFFFFFLNINLGFFFSDFSTQTALFHKEPIYFFWFGTYLNNGFSLHILKILYVKISWLRTLWFLFSRPKTCIWQCELILFRLLLLKKKKKEKNWKYFSQIFAIDIRKLDYDSRSNLVPPNFFIRSTDPLTAVFPQANSGNVFISYGALWTIDMGIGRYLEILRYS